MNCANVAGRFGLAPGVPAGRFVAELCSPVEREPVIGAREVALVFMLDLLVVGVEIERAGRVLAVLRSVAGDAITMEDRANVAVILDVQRARLYIPEGRFVVCVPLEARFARRAGADQGRRVDEVPDLVVGFGRTSFLE